MSVPEGGYLVPEQFMAAILEGVTKPGPYTRTWTYTPREWTRRDEARWRLGRAKDRIGGAWNVLRGTAQAIDYTYRDDE